MNDNTAVMKKTEETGRAEAALMPPVDVIEDHPASPCTPTCRAYRRIGSRLNCMPIA